MKVVAIVQARMGSTRLPGKVLKDLGGEPMLVRVIERVRRAEQVQQVVVATSTKSDDDAIAKLAEQRGWAYFRGSEDDVLDRYYRAALQFGAEAVVRVTSDCPLSDPALIDEHVSRMLERWDEVDFVSNMIRESYPLGLAVEVVPMDVLTRMHRLTEKPEWREHVTTLAYTRPNLFVIENIALPENLATIRLTVDTAEDLEVVRDLFAHFGNDRFSWQEAVRYYRSRPELAEINRHVHQKTVS